VTAAHQAGAGKEGRLALALLVAGTFFMENLDATVIAPAVPRMAASFGVPAVDLNTGISAYMLTLGIFIPVSGWIAQRFGARRVFALAILGFTLASLLCGLAQTLNQFIAMRVLQGASGAMMVPVGRLVVLRATPKERLIAVIATLTWPALVAPVLGPPLGGLITEQADWRWIFYLNLPLGLLAFIAALVLVPRGDAAQRRPFDWSGFLLTGAGLFSLLWAAEAAGRANVGWAGTLLCAVAGLGFLAAAAWHLGRTGNPMVDLAALRAPTYAVTIWGGSLFRIGISALPFLLPLMLQVAFGYDALQSGMVLMAVFAGNLAMKPFTTRMLTRFGFRPVLVGNGLLNAAATAACAGFTHDTPLLLICALLFLCGLTRSLQFTALNTLAFADVPQPQMTGANTLFSAAIQLSTGLGIAFGAVALRLGEWATAASAMDAAVPFRFAFLAIACLSALGVLDALSLQPTAGAHVIKGARRDGKSAPARQG
jgi:EmrB/QacA subfamily drug resistance transporter